ncbi:MAG TPA: PAS domain S-box protein [Terriglobales bacterium]|nr:PAS domain S-box protein [Terriglobales bacterium]
MAAEGPIHRGSGSDTARVTTTASEQGPANEPARHTANYARNLIEASLDPLVTISRDGLITDVNHATELATGISRDRLIGSDFADYFTDPDRARRGYQQAFSEGYVRDYPLAIRCACGTAMEVLYNATVFRNEAGEVEGIFAAARDVTERTRAELAARRLAAIVESSDDAIIGKTLEGIVLTWNQGAERLYGYSAAEMVGRSVMAVVPAEHQGEVRELLRRIAAGERIEHHETVRQRKDGSRVDVSVTLSPTKDARGEVTGASTIIRDITERKRAEEAVRRANAYNRSLIEASVDPLVTIGSDGKITDVNAATEAATGCGRQELIGTDFSDYFTDPAQARAGYEQVFREGLVRDYPLELRHRTGSVVSVLYNASIYRDQGGNTAGAFAAARDITARKRAEDEVRKLNQELEQRVQQRTAELQSANLELEAFTYSVSHDLRAPLRHLSGFAKLLLEENAAVLNATGRHYVDEIRDAARRMGQLVDDLLELSRMNRQALNPQPVALEPVIQQAVRELAPEIGQRAIEWKIAPLPHAVGDPVLLKQVFANLLANAVKFTRPRNPAVIEVGEQVAQGETVYFVRDNGVGFDMRYIDKLFGIFQRLHRTEDFEGTGVGLAVVQRIIHRHGGRVWAEAQPDRGATFFFTLGSAEPQSSREVHDEVAIAN